MSAKAELHQLVERLSDPDAQAALDYLHELLDDDELTDEEWALVRQGEEELARRESITLDELASRHAGILQ